MIHHGNEIFYVLQNLSAGDIANQHSDFLAQVQAISTVILGILAIFGPYIRKLLLRPHLNFQVFPSESEAGVGGPVFVYRLLITNNGKAPARNIRASLHSIRDEEDKQLPGFVPVPLNWTRINGNKRDVGIGEPALLDVIMTSPEFPEVADLCWARSKRSRSESNAFLTLQRNETYKLEIDFFERDGRLQTVIVSCRPDTPDSWKVEAL